MNRALVWVFVLAMLVAVVGQEIELRSVVPQETTAVVLHRSRLLAFLADIRTSHPAVYDSIVLNVGRIAQAPAGSERHRVEEVLVAKRLLAELAE